MAPLAKHAGGALLKSAQEITWASRALCGAPEVMATSSQPLVAAVCASKSPKRRTKKAQEGLATGSTPASEASGGCVAMSAAAQELGGLGGLSVLAAGDGKNKKTPKPRITKKRDGKGATFANFIRGMYHHAMKLASAVLVAALVLLGPYLAGLERVSFTGRYQPGTLPEDLQAALEEEIQRYWNYYEEHVVRHCRVLPEAHEHSQLVRQVGQRLQQAALAAASPADRERLEGLQLVVLEGIGHLASVSPDGKVYVDAGFVRDIGSKDVDMLAFVLGHEIAHHLAKHVMYDRLVESTLGAESRHTDPLVWGRALLWESVSSAPVTESTFLREEEYEADYMGMCMAAQAGYNPEGGVRAMQYLAKLRAEEWVNVLEAYKSGKVKGIPDPTEEDRKYPRLADRLAHLQRHLPAAQAAYERAVQLASMKASVAPSAEPEANFPVLVARAM